MNGAHEDDELTLLREWGRVLVDDDARPDPARRAEVLARAVGPAGEAGPPLLGWRRWGGRAVRSRGGLLVGAAAAAAIALLVVPTLTTNGGGAPADSAAAAVLHQAAQAAAARAASPVPAGSFVFTESVTRYEEYSVMDGVEHGALGPATDRLIWLPAHGQVPGLLRTRPHDGSEPWQNIVLGGCASKPGADTSSATTAGCDQNPQPAYLADLPRTADAMVTYLYTHSHGGNPPDVQAFITVGDLLRENYLPPAAEAALFQAAARIPGTVVVHGEHDVVGRPATAVALDNGTARNELLFDPGSGAFLGEKSVLRQAGTLGPVGTVVGSSAVLRTAIVARAGQLP